MLLSWIHTLSLYIEISTSHNLSNVHAGWHSIGVLLGRLGLIASAEVKFEMFPGVVHLNHVFLSIEKAQVVKPPQSICTGVTILVPRYLKSMTVGSSLAHH